MDEQAVTGCHKPVITTSQGGRMDETSAEPYVSPLKNPDPNPPITLPDEGSRAEELLLQVVAELRRQGTVNRSLRQIASSVGTSHRMLQYYFGTRENLLSLVMMQFSKEYIARLDPVPPANRAAQVQRSWDLFRDPTNRLQTQLMFVLTQAATEHPDVDIPGLRYDVDGYAAYLAVLGEAEGLTAETARHEGHFIIASLLGLYLDHFSAKDDARVDDNFRVLLRWIQHSTDEAGRQNQERGNTP